MLCTLNAAVVKQVGSAPGISHATQTSAPNIR